MGKEENPENHASTCKDQPECWKGGSPRATNEDSPISTLLEASLGS